jgi:Protein of unknwon function (DUF3310)
MTDRINPAHYQGPTGVECREIQRAVLSHEQMVGYWRGCVLKYIFRYERKGGVEDLRKAIRCIEFLIQEIEAGDGPGINGVLPGTDAGNLQQTRRSAAGWMSEQATHS